MNANITNKNVIFIMIWINQTAQPFKIKFGAWWAHLKSPDCLSAAPDIIVILNPKFVGTFSSYVFSLLQRAGIERKSVNL